MRDDEEIEKIYTRESDVKEIVDRIRNLSFEDLKKSRHYEMSVLQKNTDEEKLKEYFRKFDRIKMVFYRRRKSGYVNYDFHYEIEDGTFIVYAIDIDGKPPVLINGFHADKNFKRFAKAVARRYWKKMV